MTVGFSQSDLDRLANEVLTLVEFEEARLLNWGFVRPQLDLRDLLPDLLENLPPVGRALWDRASENGVVPSAILDNLLQRQLIVENTQKLHRSRFAEAVRLLFLLRQILPWLPWNEAPRLVSDMRLHLQRRRYPRRDVSARELLTDLDLLNLDEIEQAVTEALLRDTDGNSLLLARFQKEAALAQLQALQTRGDHGIVIGAGTGAGKTKAFYIPAFAHIAGSITAEHVTQALAIYPRIELLKDQISEAFNEARKLDTLLRSRGKRTITMGAYYGDTPHAARFLLNDGNRDGWIFPIFPCPACGENLVWNREDLEAEADENEAGRYGSYARLICRSCRFEITSHQLVLTREHMLREPPDILFTTTEMLNRRLSRTREHRLFGVGTRNPPRLLLLDEIHTYEGVAGAQVGYLLRRWRHARGHHPTRGLVLVGLSATLTQAEQFFAQLTGLPIERVTYLTPADEEIVEEGVEYNLILKGDPVSGTSLLSTSVQTAMLLGRILDTSSNAAVPAVSRGAYGHKIFAFTDTLDVINRWFHIEQDAETRNVLSQFRARPYGVPTDELRRRNEAGQWWWMAEQIGHDLMAPLILDLTSSQYRGVRPEANLVIATSTLEVGFNDPLVGAVIQHKAPRSMASFLQRKGRAGRTRAMRPWMIVVTSAYGRDRWAFQHAETLFQPSLPPIQLPLENIYVRKMQAAYALMDWLASVISRQHRNIDIWGLLSSDSRHRDSYLQAPRKLISRVLSDILDGGQYRAELCAHLSAALALGTDTEVLDQILWGEPRPLLLDIIPTVLRQIETDWQSVTVGVTKKWTDTISPDPLPDYVTPNLFSLLSLPELILHIPESRQRTNDLRTDETMSLVHGMTEFAPGHVSKRYARSHLTREAHWLALPDDERIDKGGVQLRDLLVDRDGVPQRVGIDGNDVLVYRPRAYTLSVIPSTVLSTSNARLAWRSRFRPEKRGEGARAGDVPVNELSLVAEDSPWSRLVTACRAFMASTGSWVAVTRAACGVRTATRYQNGVERRRRLTFFEGDQAAALGFTFCVDGLAIDMAPLDVERLFASRRWTEIRRSLAPHYMLHRLESDNRLVERELSDFELGWLWQLEVSMLVATAVAQQCDLATAARQVQQHRLALTERTMDVIFQSQQVDESEDEQTPRLRERLLGLMSDPDVVAALEMSATSLWVEPDSAFVDWLKSSYASSLAAVLFDALTKLVPSVAPEDLNLDVDGTTIWITEQTPGGVGLISRIVQAVALYPDDLEMQLCDTVQHCDREALANELFGIAQLVRNQDEKLLQVFQSARAAATSSTQGSLLRTLIDVLEEQAIPGTRDLIVSINTRFLKPNSSWDTDKLLADLVTHWYAEEVRIQCVIDPRVMAVAAIQLPDIQSQTDAVLARIGGEQSPVDETQIFNLLQSLLWLNCRDSCPDCIEHTSPYQRLAKPSRRLIAALIEPETQPVAFADPNWEQLVLAHLSDKYQVELICESSQIAQLQNELHRLLVTPLDVGYQQHYVAIDRLARHATGWLVGLVLREYTRGGSHA